MPSLQFGRIFFISVFAVFGIVALALVAASFGSNDGPPAAFLALWLAALVWNAYWWLFRIALELTMDRYQLTATMPLRSRQIALDDIVEIRPLKLASNGIVISIAGQRPVLALATAGMRGFVDELARRRPEIPIRAGWRSQAGD